jgi:hypothetical protein
VGAAPGQEDNSK